MFLVIKCEVGMMRWLYEKVANKFVGYSHLITNALSILIFRKLIWYLVIMVPDYIS